MKPTFEPDVTKRDGNQLVAEPSVELFKKEVHTLLFQACLEASLYNKETVTYREYCSLVQGIVQLAVRTGLICPNEANDWLDIIHERNAKCLMDIVKKWYTEKGEGDGDGY